MTDRFSHLLSELSPFLGLELHPDRIGACTIKIKSRFFIQLQLDASQEKLYLFSKIIEIPPGKFRENVLKEALKANCAPDPLIGILCYKISSNQLVIYQEYPVGLLNGERIAGLIGPFLEMVEQWHLAIEQGRSAPSIASSSSLPLFGIRP